MISGNSTSTMLHSLKNINYFKRIPLEYCSDKRWVNGVNLQPYNGKKIGRRKKWINFELKS